MRRLAAPGLALAFILAFVLGTSASSEPVDGIRVPSVEAFNALDGRVTALEGEVAKLKAQPAATPTPTPTPEPSPTPTPTPTPEPTPEPTPTPTPAPDSTSLRGWQLTANNVGLAPHGLSCSTLPAYTGSLKPARGAVISGVRVSGNLNLSNGGITVEKSCIKPTSGDNRAVISNDVCGANECVVPASSPQVIIRDSVIDASAAPAASIAATCAFRGVGILQRNYITGMGSGICFFGTGYALDALAEQNYVTGLRSSGDAHREAATIRDFRKNPANTRTAVFRNNRLDCSGDYVTAGLFIQPTWVDIHNVTVTGNYFEGAGYNLYTEKAGGTYSNLRAVDNRFRPTGWGASTTSGPGWSEWRDNYRYDATKADGRGAVVNP